MTIPENCDKLCRYIVISRATARIMIQSNILKNIINKLRCNPKKNVQITQMHVRKDNRELHHTTQLKGTTDTLEVDDMAN